MLLATRNPVIELQEVGASVNVHYAEREWSFPRGDCILLPIENTTAELIARYIASRLRESLRTHEGFVPDVLRVEVEEPPGVSGTIEGKPQ
jgi:6-pyruvoyltetrahydropterin/6-carboxytetrahydropterin synthase